MNYYDADISSSFPAEALKSLGKCGNKSQLAYLREAGKVDSHRNVVAKAAIHATEIINGK